MPGSHWLPTPTAPAAAVGESTLTPPDALESGEEPQDVTDVRLLGLTAGDLLATGRFASLPAARRVIAKAVGIEDYGTHGAAAGHTEAAGPSQNNRSGADSGWM